VELSSVLGNWPEGLRAEIVQLNLATARLALPLSLVEAALKQGRAVFRWKVLRSYLEPAASAGASAFDATELELPLNVLAPLFIAHKKAQAAPKRRLTVDESIPDLFFGSPGPESAPAASPRAVAAEPQSVAAPPAPAVSTPPGPRENKVVDTNYYVWDDVNETARVDETEFKRRPPSSGTDFIVKYATPNEIVSRAAAIDGVAGALIALPDGLMVASRIPPDLNGDTLAAFLPQLFAKVSQCTKELRMGELNNLAFTVGNVPWKIFRVNAIFFAAFGRQGEALPTAPLAALAAELDRRQR
jgi:predicted regulator of Ras-like GTPase activity (Roadblock/LC7/MglB family)